MKPAPTGLPMALSHPGKSRGRSEPLLVIHMVKPAREHTRFEKARIIGARALQISMGAPLYVTEQILRDEFRDELVSLYGVEEASVRFVLDPLKIALYEYEHELIPIDVDPHDD